MSIAPKRSVARRMAIIALVMTAVGVVALVLRAGQGLYGYLGEASSDRYACDDAAQLVVYYMEHSKGCPPAGWEELKGVYAGFQQEWSRWRPFDELEARVNIRFEWLKPGNAQEPVEERDIIVPRNRIDLFGGASMARRTLHRPLRQQSQ